jgi:hypothetical protein
MVSVPFDLNGETWSCYTFLTRRALRSLAYLICLYIVRVEQETDGQATVFWVLKWPPNMGPPQALVFCISVYRIQPITVAEWSKAWSVLARLDAAIVGSNPTWGIDVYSMFVLSCVGRGLVMSRLLVQRVLPTVLDKETEVKRKVWWMPHAPVGAKKEKRRADITKHGIDIILVSYWTRSGEAHFIAVRAMINVIRSRIWHITGLVGCRWLWTMHATCVSLFFLNLLRPIR